MQVSNLFICPSRSETFGLTVAEAALSGQFLVLNSNLPCMSELAGAGNALYVTFGSYRQKVDNSDWGRFYGDIARILLHRFDSNEVIKVKTRYRQQYNMDAVWKRIEGVLQAEAFGARIRVPAMMTG
jgi:hypothetical protein